jgi:opacity protein-like surface antigen
MKKCLSALAEPLLWKIPLLAAIGAIGTVLPATAGELQATNVKVTADGDRGGSISNPDLVAQTSTESSGKTRKKYYVAPTIVFGNTITSSAISTFGTRSITQFGVTGRIGVTENISVRPFISFGSGSSKETIGLTPVDVSYSTTTYGLSATYDLNLPNSEFTPYGGLGYASNSVSSSFSTLGNTANPPVNSKSGVYVEIGTDYQVADSIILNANYKLLDGGSLFGIAVGYGF